MLHFEITALKIEPDRKIQYVTEVIELEGAEFIAIIKCVYRYNSTYNRVIIKDADHIDTIYVQ